LTAAKAAAHARCYAEPKRTLGDKPMKILVPVDGSKYSDAALAFIASRTTLIGAKPEVELLNVQPPVPPRIERIASRATIRGYLAAEANQILEPAVAKLLRAGLAVRSGFAVGAPGAEIARAAARIGADLIVMGSHGHGAVKGLLLGSVTQAVLASCTTPLLVVRDAAAPRRDSLAVGIAVDGSKYGAAAVRYALAHRDLWGASPTLRLLHVVPDLAALVIPGLGDAPLALYKPEQVVAMQTERFDAAVGPARKQFERAGLKVDAVCLIGNDPGGELAAYAKREKLDVLLLGSHGRGALKSAVLGSVASRVAAQCRTPLLLVREA
jgi:nucleotide-binding universal stress UspA family protein